MQASLVASKEGGQDVNAEKFTNFCPMKRMWALSQRKDM